MTCEKVWLQSHMPYLGVRKMPLAIALLFGSTHRGCKRQLHGHRQYAGALAIWLYLKCRQRWLMLLHIWDIKSSHLPLKYRWKVIVFSQISHQAAFGVHEKVTVPLALCGGVCACVFVCTHMCTVAYFHVWKFWFFCLTLCIHGHRHTFCELLHFSKWYVSLKMYF